jgi:hypothetical protein
MTVIAVKNVPASTLVPILRPLLPVSGHLAGRIRREMRGRILKPAML